jgi:hypothetical protein
VGFLSLIRVKDGVLWQKWLALPMAAMILDFAKFNLKYWFNRPIEE